MLIKKNVLFLSLITLALNSSADVFPVIEPAIGSSATAVPTATEVPTLDSGVNTVASTEETSFSFGCDKIGDIELVSGWNLVGGVDTINLIPECGENSISWSFENNIWIKNPTSVKKGQGFWIKQ